MTNKTEMASAPLYATEEMKRAGMERMAQAQRDGSASLHAFAAVCWEAMIECYQESTAPAEDVRAVGEEPVMYSATDHIECLLEGTPLMVGIMSRRSPTDGFEPLYRHPQRPVVLPERWTSQHFPPHMSREDVAIRVEIQNACIDEFEGLNK